MKLTKHKDHTEMIVVTARVELDHVEILKAHNINVSAIVRQAVAKAVKELGK